MITGIGLVGVLSATIASYFVGQPTEPAEPTMLTWPSREPTYIRDPGGLRCIR